MFVNDKSGVDITPAVVANLDSKYKAAGGTPPPAPAPGGTPGTGGTGGTGGAGGTNPAPAPAPQPK
jgi:hypothetical protein